MSPIIRLAKPARTPIEDVPRLIDPRHTAAPLLVYMCRRALHSWSTDLPRLLVVMATKAPHKMAAFEWNIMRINDSLPLVGWRVMAKAGGRYSLGEISDFEFAKVVERWERKRWA